MNHLLTTLALGLILATPSLAATKEAANKKLVIEFYNMAFNQHKPAEAADKYFGSKYIQHNPFVKDGKQPFVDFFVPFFKQHPHTRATIKRVIAEGDLVVVHVHSQMDAHESGRAVMDIFRLEKGKIVEHWDVSQEVPQDISHKNTMF